MPDIVDLISAEHALIGRLFAELDTRMEACAVAKLSAVWADLAALLETHAAATREICYLSLLSEAVKDGFSADLDDVTEAVAEARLQPAGSRLWWLAVRSAREALASHIEGIQAGPLPALRRRAPTEQREVLGRQWQAFIAARNDDTDAS